MSRGVTSLTFGARVVAAPEAVVQAVHTAACVGWLRNMFGEDLIFTRAGGEGGILWHSDCDWNPIYCTDAPSLKSIGGSKTWVIGDTIIHDGEALWITACMTESEAVAKAAL
jgi:hypothetical protein